MSPRSRFLTVQALTTSRVLLACGFAAVHLGCRDEPTWRSVTAGLVLLGLGEISDVLDGLLARRWRQVSRWGQMFDPYADSVSRLIVYWSLACAGTAIVFVPLVMALRDITVVYSRVVMAQHGVSVGAAWAGKVKAVVQGSCSFLLVLTPLYQQYTGPWIIHLWSWIVAVVTAGSVIPYVTKAAAATLTSPPGPPAA